MRARHLITRDTTQGQSYEQVKSNSTSVLAGFLSSAKIKATIAELPAPCAVWRIKAQSGCGGGGAAMGVCKEKRVSLV